MTDHDAARDVLLPAADRSMTAITRALRLWKGRVESDDHLFEDPGTHVRLDVDVDLKANVRACDRRFAVVALAKLHDLDTWIETYAAEVKGRFYGHEAIIETVKILRSVA